MLAAGLCVSPLARADSTKKIEIAVPHQFSKTEAKARVGYLLEYWNQRYAITNTWTSDSVKVTGHVHGLVIDAVFTIEEARVSAIAKDPGFFWRGRTRNYVETKLKKYLDLTYREP
jgi:Putative polyhydroxyalkanoic acid system protein (PHA_gran_rgn)